MRILTRSKLDQLKAAMTGFAVALAATRQGHSDPATVEEQLRYFKLLGSEFVANFTVAPSRYRRVR
jgi:hypothetical protein